MTDPMTRKITALRQAADALRADPARIPHETLAVMVADWMDAEAALLGSLEPMIEMVNLALTSEGHDTVSSLRLGMTEDNEIAVRGDTSGHAERIAAALEAREN